MVVVAIGFRCGWLRKWMDGNVDGWERKCVVT